LSLQIINAKKYPLKEEEIWALAEIETHPKVIEWNTNTHVKDTNEMYHLFKQFFEKLSRDEGQIFLVGKLKERTVGFVGVHCKSKRMKYVGVVGITIHPDYWGKGFGTELLKVGVEYARKAGFLRLEAGTLAKNKAMIKIAEKAGFKLEDIKRNRIRVNKGYEDAALLSMVLDRDDY
jgi:putative acetyltransferase